MTEANISFLSRTTTCLEMVTFLGNTWTKPVAVSVIHSTKMLKFFFHHVNNVLYFIRNRHWVFEITCDLTVTMEHKIKICTVRNQLLLLEFHWTVKFGWPPTSLNYSKQHHFISLSLYWDCKGLYNKLIKLFCFCLSFCCCSVKLSLNCVMSSLKHSVIVIRYFPKFVWNELQMVTRHMHSCWGFLSSSLASCTPEIAWVLLTSVWRPWSTESLRHTNHAAPSSLCPSSWKELGIGHICAGTKSSSSQMKRMRQIFLLIAEEILPIENKKTSPNS